MKQKFFFCLLWFSVISASGQTQNIDSLISLSKTATLTQKEEIELYAKICDIYFNSDLEKCMQYAEKGLKISGKDQKGISVFYHIMGNVSGMKGEYDTSLIYLNKALDIASEINSAEKKMGVHTSLGTVYVQLNEFDKGLENYMAALTFAEQLNDKPQSISIQNNIASIHQRLKNHDRAIFYLEKSKNMAEEINDPFGKCYTYLVLGNIYIEKRDSIKAVEYIEKSVTLSKANRIKRFEIIGIESLAQIYFECFDDYVQAEKLATEGLVEAEKFGDHWLTYSALAVLSNIYHMQKRYKECEEAAYKAWQMDSANITHGRSITANLIYANLYLGNNEQVVHFLKKHNDIIDQLNSQSLHENLSDMEVKYETEKKEMRIASLEKERQLYIWLIVLSVLFVLTLAIILWLQTRNARKEKQLIATRSVLDGEMSERTRLSRDLHDRLSGNLSAVKVELSNNPENLQSVCNKLDSCIEEIRRVSHNLMPTSLQFGMKVALEDFTAQFPNVHFYFFGENKRIEERMEFVVYCCANELVNNALRHAEAKNINVQLIQDGKHVSLTVQDDGCGFDEKSVTRGIGLKNIRDRVASCDGKIDMVTSPGKGTETTIELRIEN